MNFFDTGDIDYNFYKPKAPKRLLESQSEIFDEEADRIIEILRSDAKLSNDELQNYINKLDLYYYQKSKPSRMSPTNNIKLAIINDFISHKGPSISSYEKEYGFHHTIIERNASLYDQIRLIQMFFPTENIPESFYELPSELQDLHPYSDNLSPGPNSMQTDVDAELSKYTKNLEMLKELSAKAGKESVCEDIPVLLPIDDLALPIELCFSFSNINELRNLVKNERLKYVELENELKTLMKQQRSKDHVK